MKYLKSIGVLVLGLILGGIVTHWIVRDDMQNQLDHKNGLLEYYKKKVVEYENLEKTEIVEEESETMEESRETFYVKTLNELVFALGDDRIIHITDSINITDEISTIIPSQDKQRITFTDERRVSETFESSFYDIEYLGEQERGDVNLASDSLGFSLTIKNTHNLTLMGNKESLTPIIIRNPNSQVLGFKDNQNLTIKNLEVYHDLPVLYDCGKNAPVLSFYKDHYVTVKNCSLNGSGTVGIDASEVNYLKVDNTIIHNCSVSALSLYRVGYFAFNNGQIIDNDNDINYGLIFHRESNLTFNKTIIADNNTHCFLKGSSPVDFQYCKIVNNQFKDACTEVDFNETNDVDRNQFEFGEAQ